MENTAVNITPANDILTTLKGMDPAALVEIMAKLGVPAAPAAPVAPAVEVPTISIEERKENLRAEIDTLVAHYNECVEYASAKSVNKAGNDLNDKIEEYNGLCWKSLVDTMRGTEDPMRQAAMDLTYEVIAARDKKQDGGGTKRVVETAEKPIDILALSRELGGIGHDKAWNDLVEAFNYRLTIQFAIELGIHADEFEELKASYKMRDAAKKVEKFGSAYTPETFDWASANQNLLENLEKVVEAMIGEHPYPVKAEHAALIHGTFLKKGRSALTVTAANHRTMRQYCLEVAHAALTGGNITLNYKKAKAKK